MIEHADALEKRPYRRFVGNVHDFVNDGAVGADRVWSSARADRVWSSARADRATARDDDDAAPGQGARKSLGDMVEFPWKSRLTPRLKSQ
jgi:hypothetical protein